MVAAQPETVPCLLYEYAVSMHRRDSCVVGINLHHTLFQCASLSFTNRLIYSYGPQSPIVRTFCCVRTVNIGFCVP